ncbi:MAG: FlgD immunoglobulin-like domain containing protein [Candidatus Eiseniibacteriota bacterium]
MDVPGDRTIPEGVLEAPVPNPTAGGSTLGFALARTGVVEVSVHDVTGRRVRVLHLGSLPAGRHQVAWDGHADGGTRVAAGVYFACLGVDGARAGTRKVTILR